MCLLLGLLHDFKLRSWTRLCKAYFYQDESAKKAQKNIKIPRESDESIADMKATKIPITNGDDFDLWKHPRYIG